jgi:uncharacterized membrane protein
MNSTARTEAFSDGIFAIAMTLLIIEIKVPHLPHGSADARHQLSAALLSLWPSFLAFFLSFGTILIMWVNHHGLFKHAHTADNRLLFCNGFLLLMVTFMPFPTALLAEYLDRRAGAIAAMFYCASLVLVCVGYNLTFWGVLANRHPGPHPQHIASALARVRRAYRFGFVAYLAATAVSLLNPYVAVAICFLMWPLWAMLRYWPTAREIHSNVLP